MAQLSSRIEKISPSSTTAMSRRAKDLKDSGKDVVSLAIGEPGFSTPDVIKNAGINAINENITKYTNVDGLKELRESIVNRYKRFYDIDFSADQVCVSSGAKHSLHNIFSCILDDGDEVIYFAPYWVSYPALVELAGGKSVVVKTDIKDNFEININELKKHINDKTKAIVINSPNNPTGLVYSEKCIRELANLLVKYPNVWIIGDDIYDEMVFDKKNTLISKVSPELADRYVIVSGVSKNYAMTGWRVGYTIAPIALNNAIKKFQSQTATCACSISQYAAITALNMQSSELQYFVDSYKSKSEYIVKELSEIPLIDVKNAEGAFYLFPDIRNVIEKSKFKDDVEFCNNLLDQEYVAMMPGSAFGLDGYARISCANSMSELQKAMERLKRFISNN